MPSSITSKASNLNQQPSNSHCCTVFLPSAKILQGSKNSSKPVINSHGAVTSATLPCQLQSLAQLFASLGTTCPGCQEIVCIGSLISLYRAQINKTALFFGKLCWSLKPKMPLWTVLYMNQHGRTYI